MADDGANALHENKEDHMIIINGAKMASFFADSDYLDYHKPFTPPKSSAFSTNCIHEQGNLRDRNVSRIPPIFVSLPSAD